MKYRHHYHAGNFADLIKHLIWHWCLSYLQKNPSQIDIIDTHSGLGAYSLDELSEEFLDGIGLFSKKNEFADSEAGTYYALLHSFLSSKVLPGSPLIAQSVKREQDYLWLFENNAEVFDGLIKLRKNASHTSIKNTDGLVALKDLLHTPIKRMAILIDPVYERPEEYEQIADLLMLIHQKKPQALVALWYPLGKRASLMNPIWQVAQHWSEKKLNLIYEKTNVCSDNPGLQAAGMLMLNPPYLLKNYIESLSSLLSEHMGIQTYIDMPKIEIAHKFGVVFKR